MVLNIVKGTRVRVVYQIAGLQKPREIVADAIDADDRTLWLSGRPKFGTTQIPLNQVLEVWETDRDIAHPVIYRGETRLL